MSRRCCPHCGKPLAAPTRSELQLETIALAMTGVADLDAARREVTIAGAAARLSPMRWRLFGALFAAHGEWLSAGWLADFLYGEDSADNRLTVRVQLCTLRTSLAHSRFQIFSAYGRGYRMAAAPLAPGHVVLADELTPNASAPASPRDAAEGAAAGLILADPAPPAPAPSAAGAAP